MEDKNLNVEESVKRTLRWLIRCKESWLENINEEKAIKICNLSRKIVRLLSNPIQILFFPCLIICILAFLFFKI